MSTVGKILLDRLICLNYHAVNQSNKVVDVLICQAGFHYTALPREASLPWLAEAGIETEARAQLQRKHVPATWSAKQLGVVF